jgi:L-alanine-DL-glutamate epimerase-like enolase superfamily enzyme
MKITGIELFNLRFEYPNSKGFRYSGGFCTARVTTVVLVRTDTRHTGIGSCYTHPGLAQLLIEDQFAPLLMGRDPRQTDELWNLMYDLTRWYGRKGAALSTLGALDVAFWDLRGKAENAPVYQLLGGAQNCCPAYASALLWQDAAGAAREALQLKARGWKRLKMRMGQGEAQDLENLRAIRQAIGPDTDLMCDAGMRLDVATAQRIGKVLEEENVFWFEEPFEPEDLASYRALHGTLKTRIAAGENEFGVQGFRDLIEPPSVDIVQPDVARCGGISEAHKIAAMASARNIGVATHTWSDAIAVVANAHVVAACPTGITVEVDQTGNPFIEELLATPLPIQSGVLHLGEKPGLSIELDEATLQKYRMADPLRVPAGRYSDMVFGAEYFSPASAYRKLS